MQQGFDTAGFWPTVQRNGITCTILLGVMAAYLVKQAPLPGETPGARHTTLRHVVPSADSEDEVLVAVALVDGHTLEPAELIDFLRPRLAHSMIPRYLRVLAELPKTPTAKVQKVALRAEGVTADTWDRERAGIRISRDRF